MRFAYDSIYVSLRKHRSTWSVLNEQVNDFEFVKSYVGKLFRQKHRPSQIFIQQNTNINKEDEQQNKANQSWLKKRINSIYIWLKKRIISIYIRLKKRITSIYVWDDDFRFTTMVVCTYTVAIVFLYYLACTFVFLYISRTTGHIAFLKSYIESSGNVGK